MKCELIFKRVYLNVGFRFKGKNYQGRIVTQRKVSYETRTDPQTRVFECWFSVKVDDLSRKDCPSTQGKL